MATYNLALILKNCLNENEFLLVKQTPPPKFFDEEYDSFVDTDLWDLPSTKLNLLDGELEPGIAIEGMESLLPKINFRKYDIESAINRVLEQVRIEAVDKGDWKFLKLVEEPEFGPGLPAHTIYITGLTGGNESLPELCKWMHIQSSLNWLLDVNVQPPKPLDFFSAEKLVRAKMDAQQEEKGLVLRNKQRPSVNLMNQAAIDSHLSSSSEESIDTIDSTPPLQLTTRPSCYSSASSSSEMETLNLNPNPEEEELITKLKSPQVFEIEEAVISLRKITKTKEDTRVELCTPRLLSVLRSLITSRYTNIQVNSTACLVNLSLEKVNKVKIVRSGIVPALIDVLKGGFPEAKEHACGAIFSLALEDHNKTAIGVLGALPPLLHLLRSESEWSRHDSALALFETPSHQVS